MKAVVPASSGGPGVGKSSSGLDYESSDVERHFKRKPSRYEPSPPPLEVVERGEEGRHSRGLRDREHHRSGR